MFIYKITNKTNGKMYIGQTIQEPKKRWYAHCNSGRAGIGQAIKKYGRENFTFEVLWETFDRDTLDRMEQVYIKHYNTIAPNGYNLCEGGNAPRPTEETRRKQSKAHKGKKLSEEHKQKLSKTSSKPVICVETEVEYSSAKECAEQMNLRANHIASVLTGKRKTHGGYTFAYKEE
ncbi:MAG: GIY-YIG nuclease family protein [Aeromonadaceae bacterium]